MDKREITPQRVQAEYVKGQAYNDGLELYETVKQCERFYEGDQWNGLKVKQARPITVNFIRQIANYKVAQIVSDDVTQQIEPFLPDEAATQTATVLEQAIDRVVERQKIKDKHRSPLQTGLKAAAPVRPCCRNSCPFRAVQPRSRRPPCRSPLPPRPAA